MNTCQVLKTVFFNVISAKKTEYLSRLFLKIKKEKRIGRE